MEPSNNNNVQDAYLTQNSSYWNKGYLAENVESFVFRSYGRVFRDQLGLSGAKGENLLDFGCGCGSALHFFHQKGFNVYGVDISSIDIVRCKEKMPKIANHFSAILPKPNINDNFFQIKYDLVIAIQSLYYLSDSDFDIRIQNLYNQMNNGGIIFATMMGTKNWYYQNSTVYKDGLRKVDISTNRLNVKNYYMSFVDDEVALLKKFNIFKKINVGYYDALYREDEGSDFHYTFVGQKQEGM